MAAVAAHHAAARLCALTRPRHAHASLHHARTSLRTRAASHLARAFTRTSHLSRAPHVHTVSATLAIASRMRMPAAHLHAHCALRATRCRHSSHAPARTAVCLCLPHFLHHTAHCTNTHLHPSHTLHLTPPPHCRCLLAPRIDRSSCTSYRAAAQVTAPALVRIAGATCYAHTRAAAHARTHAPAGSSAWHAAYAHAHRHLFASFVRAPCRLFSQHLPSPSTHRDTPAARTRCLFTPRALAHLMARLFFARAPHILRALASRCAAHHARARACDTFAIAAS